MDITKYIGTPYKPHGRTVEEGLDCWGLVLLIYKEMGINLPDPVYDNTEIATNKRIMESLESTVPNIKLEKPETGCFIEFKVFGEPSHVGIYLEAGDFIHSSRKTGVIVDKLYRWEKRIAGYYKYDNR